MFIKLTILFALLGTLSAANLKLKANSTTVTVGQPIALTCEAVGYQPVGQQQYDMAIQLDGKPGVTAFNPRTGGLQAMHCIARLPSENYKMSCNVKSETAIELILTPTKNGFKGDFSCRLRSSNLSLQSNHVKLG